MSILDQSSHSKPKKKKKDAVKEEEEVGGGRVNASVARFGFSGKETILDVFQVHGNRVDSRDVHIECSDRSSDDIVERTSRTQEG